MKCIRTSKIKLKDACIHTSNLIGRNHHGLQKNDINTELLQSKGWLHQTNNCYVNGFMKNRSFLTQILFQFVNMYEISTSTMFSRMNCFVYYCMYGSKVCICRWGQSQVFLPSFSNPTMEYFIFVE